MVNISYLITIHDEGKSVANLLDRLDRHIRGTNDEIIIIDDYSTDQTTTDAIQKIVKAHPEGYVKVYQHSLNNDYGTHKNYGNSLCKNEWIFQIDGDELPHTNLLINIRDIIAENQSVDLFFVPRVNDFIGVTPEHAMKWGWRLSPCPEYNNRPVVNWPDYQGRIYKNEPSRIRWDRRLHEKIEGHTKYTALPAEVDFSLYHDKTIERQVKTNERYNEKFTESENKGHGVFK
jgi:glycosyltransferase involved in cell wall biosynthesis